MDMTRPTDPRAEELGTAGDVEADAEVVTGADCVPEPVRRPSTAPRA